MKPQIFIIALTAALSGCDDPQGPIAYTPEMASFSNEFDFDPLRGPVKDFSQTLLNDHGEVTRRVSGTISMPIPGRRWCSMPITIWKLARRKNG